MWSALFNQTLKIFFNYCYSCKKEEYDRQFRYRLIQHGGPKEFNASVFPRQHYVDYQYLSSNTHSERLTNPTVLAIYRSQFCIARPRKGPNLRCPIAGVNERCLNSRILDKVYHTRSQAVSGAFSPSTPVHHGLLVQLPSRYAATTIRALHLSASLFCYRNSVGVKIT